MLEKVIPKEYEWIKEGVKVFDKEYHYAGVVSGPIFRLQSQPERWGVFLNDLTGHKLGISRCHLLELYQDTPGETLEKARAVLAEHSEAVKDSRKIMEKLPGGIDEINKADPVFTLVALADAIGGGE